jgi:aminomethyltransferase
MPVDYGSVVSEHLAVREAAGIFDVSHMGELLVEGNGALELLQRLTPNDVSRLRIGRAHYSALTNPEGCFIDDLLDIEKDFQWIQNHREGSADIRNVSDDYALIALQGPRARDTLARLTEARLEELKYYQFVEGVVADERAIISRTGYTGEDGFELLVEPERAEPLWRRLMEAGETAGLAPAGLGARDTLRLEAKMALYGNDIDEEHTVLEADLGWVVKLEKGDFLGREVLARQKQAGVTRKLVGFEMVDRGIARPGCSVLVGGEEVGPVTSGSFAPYLKKNIGLTYLPASAWTVGSEIEIDIRGRRCRASVAPTPFYKRDQKPGGTSRAARLH